MRSNSGFPRMLRFAAAGLGLAAAVLISPAQAAEGGKVFEKERCASCHDVAGPSKDKTIYDRMSRKGPDLWYAGSKFQKAFLEAWLARPDPVRPLKYNSLTEKNDGTHPRLSSKDARSVAEYLMTRKSPALKPVGIVPGETLKGRIVFIKRYSCYGCHEVKAQAKTVGGISGPSLVRAGVRLQPEWIYALLSKQKAFMPVGAMPEFSGIMTEAEMKDVSSYVASMSWVEGSER